VRLRRVLIGIAILAAAGAIATPASAASPTPWQPSRSNPDGTRSFDVQGGTVENLCTTLA
jgi:hypothetical protein